MDFALPILKMAAAAVAVVLLLLMAGRWPRALMPLALAAGFMASYLVLYPLPEGTESKAWYLGEAWKMSVVAVAVGGVLLALARIVPRWLGLALLLIMAGAVTVTVVRTTWDGWGYYAGAMAFALLAYAVGMIPGGWDDRLWAVGPLVMWLAATAASIAIMAWVDTRLGRMLVIVAVLSGVALVLGIFRGMRSMVGGSGPVLAMMFGTVLLLAAYYNEGLPRTVFGLLGAAPLAAAVAWIPGLARKPWICVLAAMGAALAVIIPALILAAQNAPALE